MKKLCFYSLLLGIGIGIILTAALHEIVDVPRGNLSGKVEQSPESNEIEKALEELLTREGQNQTVPPQENEPREREENELNTENEDKINEEEQTPVEVQIKPGMFTDAIAKLLVEKGLIENPQDFIDKAYEMNLTRKFRTGRYEILPGTPIEDILQMLTTRQN